MNAPLWTSQEITSAVDGRLDGASFVVSGVSTDSREVGPGDLFVALRAERDGHDFAAAAVARGAAGVLAERSVGSPAVLADDALRGLRRLGEAARHRAAGARRGAVTGSVGKTSVTQAVLAGLERAGRAHGSVKSYNNHIGVPLTLARMPGDTERAIFEIGMNHADEIAPLVRLVQPHAVAITNVEAVHVENFPDGALGVARAKAEIFEGLERGGVAVLNGDNAWFDLVKGEARRHGAKPRIFGAVKGADAELLRFTAAPGGASVEARIDGKVIEFPIRQSAPHWGPMSLCALLMMQALDVDLATGIAALADFEPLAGRGAERRVTLPTGGFVLIDDSYNASPVSTTAALKGLGARVGGGRKIAVLTDMLELGADAPALHAALAPIIDCCGIDQVFCAGPLMQSLWRALPAARRGAWAPTASGVTRDLIAAVRPGDTILVKGSKASDAHALAAALGALDTTPGDAR